MELDKTPPLEKGKNHIRSFKFFSAENIIDYNNCISRGDYKMQWLQAFVNEKTSKPCTRVFPIDEHDVLGKQRRGIAG